MNILPFDVDKGLGVLYRYQSVKHGNIMKIYCCSYTIVKVTAKGNWINVYGLGLKNDMKFVNSTCKKQWANITEKQALFSFIKRKNSQIHIMTSILKNVKEALEVAQNEYAK